MVHNIIGCKATFFFYFICGVLGHIFRACSVYSVEASQIRQLQFKYVMWLLARTVPHLVIVFRLRNMLNLMHLPLVSILQCHLFYVCQPEDEVHWYLMST